MHEEKEDDLEIIKPDLVVAIATALAMLRPNVEPKLISLIPNPWMLLRSRPLTQANKFPFRLHSIMSTSRSRHKIESPHQLPPLFLSVILLPFFYRPLQLDLDPWLKHLWSYVSYMDTLPSVAYMDTFPSVTLANESQSKCEGIGQTIPLHTLTLDSVLYVPDCPCNLSSTNKLAQALVSLVHSNESLSELKPHFVVNFVELTTFVSSFDLWLES